MVNRVLLAVVAAGMQGCVQIGPVMTAPAAPLPELEAAPILPVETAAENFVAVVARVEPVAEQYCRSLRRVANCDFRIVIDDRPGQPPNAFQTLDEAGRPILAFTVPLIRDARNRDELAFVLGHEAAHHIAGHIPRQQNTALAGAVLAGVLAQVSGAGEQAVATAQDLGATVGARRFSKEFELEADSLGTEIALVAGYDPMLGAAFFDRMPDPGDQFLGTHPANADRKRVVAATLARLGG
ncbi:M48 family metallopeptidase [Tabrizicola oligotrophica]|nr:M48 family metallopeptidase [Tabrizicola oligotrophica]